MMRWVPDEPVILPLLPDPRLAVGLARFTQFMTLVTSARNWNTVPHGSETLRYRPASISLKPGPTSESRPTLPSAPPGPMPPGKPGPFAVNAAVLNHADISLPEAQIRQRCGSSLGLTPGTALGRLWPAVSKFLLDPVEIVNGPPLYKKTIGKIDQSWTNSFS